MITAVRIAGVAYPVSELGQAEVRTPELGPNQNQFQINFVGLEFGMGEVLQYQYQLEGIDRDWSAPTDQRTVNYASLAPGRYRFIVRAVTGEGVISPTPATVAFTILPAIWQRWWFLTLAVTVVGLSIYSLYRYRVTQLIKLERVRTRIATDLHDDIGANLTKISILSEVARQQSGNGADRDAPLASIARISRESVAAMSDIVWAINPLRDSLGDVIRRMRLHAEESCLPREIKLTFVAPKNYEDLPLGVDMRRDLYLVFKEAVNNAVRHSGCTRLDVTLNVEKDSLSLLIRDNGHGFDRQIESDGNGLLSMQKRAESLGGKLKIESAEGAGTKIQLRFALPSRIKWQMKNDK